MIEPREGSGEDDEDPSSFSNWGIWSRCNRRCRQTRVRHCINYEECENTIQKENRLCRKSACRQKMLVLMANAGGNKKKPKKMKLMTDMSPLFFTEWSKWSPCSSSCYTKRTRKCLYAGLCDNTSMKEDYSQCYRIGDDCEKFFADQDQIMVFHHETPREEEHILDNFQCGTSNISGDLRITGGRPAMKGAWPWQILILNDKYEAFCGGILLSDKWILTAAHCIRKRLYARAGEYDLSYYEQTEQQEIVGSIFVHPRYNQETNDNDIALVKIRRPFLLNDNVKPICLPSHKDKLPEFARGTILGWGKRRNHSTYGTDILHQAQVPIITTKQCQDSFDDQYITDNMLCAGFTTGKVDSCKGDSGGPLMYKRDDGTWAVFGVTSFGDGCGEVKKYGVYANVLKYLSWIKAIIKGEETSFNDSEE